PREVAHVIDLLAKHLVQHYADDLDVLLVEERLVESDFVDRFADAAARHEDTLAFEQPRHTRIREIEHAADTGVPRAFDNHKILFPRRAIKRVLNALHEMLVVGLLDVAPRKIRLDGDGAHCFERRVNAERLVDQDRVFIDPLAIDFDKALSDRLDEPDPSDSLL